MNLSLATKTIRPRAITGQAPEHLIDLYAAHPGILRFTSERVHFATKAFPCAGASAPGSAADRAARLRPRSAALHRELSDGAR